MTTRLTRRQALRLLALSGLGGLAAACSPRTTAAPASAPVEPTRIPASPTAVPPALSSGNTPAASTAQAASTATPGPVTQPIIADIAQAATNFLNALSDDQRRTGTYAFDDAERLRWHWTTPGNFPRHGLPLTDMDQSQRDLALALLSASVSAGGFQKALDIISLQNDLGNDPQLYFVTVFGTPGGAEPWSWRFEGHHLSRHYTIVGEQLAVTPFFLGAWPTVSSAGLKAMEREEWAARELITSLAGPQRQTALFDEHTLTRHVTQNAPYVSPLDPVGLLTGELNAGQQALVLEIVHKYLDTLPDQLAAAHFGRLEAAGPENIRFGWAGSIESRRPHYYRLQGPTFLLEFDNSRGGGTHIHSVWRDFAEDFGQDLT